MPRWIIRIVATWLLFWAWLVWTSLAVADEVRLRNGDRLTGEVVNMEGGILKLRTPYGGDLKLDWSQVEGLTTDHPLVIQLQESGGPAEGENRITVTGVGTPGFPPTSSVQAINPPPPFRYRGTVTIGGNSTRGNTRTEAVNAATRWMLRYYRHRLNLEAKYNFSEANNQVTAQNSLLNTGYDFFLSQLVFLKAKTLFEKDTLQNLQLRSTYGGGIGYQFLDTPRAALSAEVGPAHVNEDFRGGPTTRTVTGQWGLKAELDVVRDRIRLFHQHEGFRDFSGREGLRILADQGIRISLNKHLYVNLEYDLRFNSRPAPGRKTTDEAFIFGVGFEWE